MDNEKDAANSSSYIDPLVTFKAVPHNSPTSCSVTSVCFLGEQPIKDKANHVHSVPLEKEMSEGSSDDEFESYFQSNRDESAKRNSSIGFVKRRLALDGTRLATCDFHGNALIWDAGKSTVVGNILQDPRGAGLSLRRIREDYNNETNAAAAGHIMYHTRDPGGTVSLHDINKLETIAAFSTGSHTFCAAAPCLGNQHLVALPSAHDAEVVIRDWRISPSSCPVACFAGAGTSSRKHGMLTSLSMWGDGTKYNVLICGMEDGSIFFHDWTRLGHIQETSSFDPLSTISLGSDPVLALDISPSPFTGDRTSFVCLAGLAGNAEDLGRLDESDRGRIAVVKASQTGTGNKWESRIRTRLGTAMGKPGAAVCRFRSDGRVFAAGGWDRRVRIFHRDGRALAILRGHEKGIQAVDWSPDARETGLLASGSSDGRVCVWRCFGTA